jgi:hypothetical protein
MKSTHGCYISVEVYSIMRLSYICEPSVYHFFLEPADISLSQETFRDRNVLFRYLLRFLWQETFQF